MKNTLQKTGLQANERHSFVVAGDFNVRANCVFHPSLETVEWKVAEEVAAKWLMKQSSQPFFSEFEYLKWALGYPWPSNSIDDSSKLDSESFLVENIFEKFCQDMDIDEASKSYLKLHQKMQALKR